MSQLAVFNHLSLPYTTRVLADTAVPEFLRICLQASGLGLSVILFGGDVDATWFRIELAPGYYFQDWFSQNNRDNNRDVIRAFRSILTRQPFFPPEVDAASFDVVLPGEESRSLAPLRAAAWYESPIVSFPVAAPWDVSPIVVIEQTLDVNGRLDSKRIELVNFYSLAVLQAAEPILRERQTASLVAGADVVENMEKMFPGVELCGKAKEQLLSGAYPPLVFEQVKESLSALSRFVQDWKSGLVTQYSHDALLGYSLVYEISGESSSVLSNPNLRKPREFWLPSGRKVCFENHIKYRYRQFRLHFFPAVEE